MEGQHGDAHNLGAHNEPPDAAQRLFSCIDKRTGDIDPSALMQVEFEHNRALTLAILRAIPTGHTLGFCVMLSPLASDADARHYYAVDVVRREGGFAFLKHQQISADVTWSDHEAADAIAIACLTAHIVPVHVNDLDIRPLKCIQDLWNTTWIHTALECLARGPGSDGWTPEAICDTGAVLRGLIDSRLRHTDGNDQMASMKAVECSAAVRTLSGALRVAPVRPYPATGRGMLFAHAIRTEVLRAASAERSLRGMLAWIDAMERTNMIFEHGLKQYQAKRIDLMMTRDSHDGS